MSYNLYYNIWLPIEPLTFQYWRRLNFVNNGAAQGGIFFEVGFDRYLYVIAAVIGNVGRFQRPLK